MELRIDQPLNLKLNLTMGQAFRWKEEEGWFSGVVDGVFIKVRQTADVLEFSSSAPEESVRPLLQHYLRLDEDVSSIYAELSRSDPKMAELVKRH